LSTQGDQRHCNSPVRRRGWSGTELGSASRSSPWDQPWLSALERSLPSLLNPESMKWSHHSE
jgi:hypothetical protein